MHHPLGPHFLQREQEVPHEVLLVLHKHLPVVGDPVLEGLGEVLHLEVEGLVGLEDVVEGDDIGGVQFLKDLQLVVVGLLDLLAALHPLLLEALQRQLRLVVSDCLVHLREGSLPDLREGSNHFLQTHYHALPPDYPVQSLQIILALNHQFEGIGLLKDPHYEPVLAVGEYFGFGNFEGEGLEICEYLFGMLGVAFLRM